MTHDPFTRVAATRDYSEMLGDPRPTRGPEVHYPARSVKMAVAEEYLPAGTTVTVDKVRLEPHQLKLQIDVPDTVRKFASNEMKVDLVKMHSQAASKMLLSYTLFGRYREQTVATQATIRRMDLVLEDGELVCGHVDWSYIVGLVLEHMRGPKWLKSLTRWALKKVAPEKDEGLEASLFIDGVDNHMVQVTKTLPIDVTVPVAYEVYGFQPLEGPHPRIQIARAVGL